MGLFGSEFEILRRDLTVFFVIDTSDNMKGANIDAVNHTIDELIPEIRDYWVDNPDAQVRIAVLEFSSGARWITINGPVEVEHFIWSNLNAAGKADMGEAFKQLANKLTRKEKGFMLAHSGAPRIFLFSNGKSTDDWQSGLAGLKENNWFTAAVKIAVAIGDDADMGVLSEFTGSKEAVLLSCDFKKFIKYIGLWHADHS